MSLTLIIAKAVASAPKNVQPDLFKWLKRNNRKKTAAFLRRQFKDVFYYFILILLVPPKALEPINEHFDHFEQ